MGFTGGISPIRTQPSPRPDPQVSNQPGPCQDKPGPGSDKPGPGHDKVGPCKPDRATSNPRLLTSLETKIFPFEKNGSRKKRISKMNQFSCCLNISIMINIYSF